MGAAATAELAAIKARPQAKPFIYLIPSWPLATELWWPLPGDPHHPHHWARLLKTIWPAPLSVVWRRRTPDGTAGPTTLALRMDEGSAAPWFSATMIRLGRALPTTSINYAGHPPLYQKDDMIQFAQRHNIFVPPCLHRGQMPPQDPPRPSTLIQILSATTYKVLRLGAISQAELASALTAKHACP